MVGSCKFLYLHLNLALIVYQYVFIVLRNCEIKAERGCGGFSGGGAIAGVVNVPWLKQEWSQTIWLGGGLMTTIKLSQRALTRPPFYAASSKQFAQENQGKSQAMRHKR